jgi:hypothetical protein
MTNRKQHNLSIQSIGQDTKTENIIIKSTDKSTKSAKSAKSNQVKQNEQIKQNNSKIMRQKPKVNSKKYDSEKSSLNDDKEINLGEDICLDEIQFSEDDYSSIATEDLYDVNDDTLFKISALSLVLKCVLR